MCFPAEDLSASPIKKDSSANDSAELAASVPTSDTVNSNTPPESPKPSPVTNEVTPTKAPVEVNGTSPEHKSTPDKSNPEPASENSTHINNAKNNSKPVEELYDIPVGK